MFLLFFVHNMNRQLVDLRMAVVMDDFSFASFAPDCQAIALSASNWLQQVMQFRPTLLLVESAWWGEGKSWHRKVSEAAPELRELLAWCQQHRVPTVFWNKEDPVHFERFLITASLFDVVFTTDMACIPHYKRALGHEHVHVLPFACQPALHHPVQHFPRLPTASFAGSYYVRFPQRILDLRSVLDAVSQLMPVDIFDRYFDSPDTNYHFPPEYKSMVKGTLRVDEMHRAYKGYAFGINMNTVKDSTTMFARRVFELLGSGTVMVSNESAGVRQFFGDVVLCSDSTVDLVQRLTPLVRDPVQRARQALRGVRAVMLQHTYAHRLDAIAQRALKRTGFLPPLPPVLLMSQASTMAQLQGLLANALHQSHQDWRMVIVVGGDIYQQALAHAGDVRVSILQWAELQGVTLSEVAQRLVWPEHGGGLAHWVGGWSAQDHYGPNYLLDLVLATRYTQARVLGKAGHFFMQGHQASVRAMDQAWRPARALAARCALAWHQVLEDEPAQPWLIDLEDRLYQNDDALALDVFNYCRGGAGQQAAALAVDDGSMDIGLNMDELMAQADAMTAAPVLLSSVPKWSAEQLVDAFGLWRGRATTAALDSYGWHVVSELPDDQAEQVWSPCIIAPAEVRAIGVWRFHVVATGGQRLQLMVQCLDVDGECLSSRIFECNQNQQLTLPFGTRGLRLGWCMSSSGTMRVKQLIFGWCAGG
jgi:spore maturation protein CgeB